MHNMAKVKPTLTNVLITELSDYAPFAHSRSRLTGWPRERRRKRPYLLPDLGQTPAIK